MFLHHAMQKPLLALIFAVASLCAAPSYAENPSTWKDPKTGLTWQRCSLGQTWNGHDCDGTPEAYNFDQAQEAVKSLGKGWRMPAASELASLVRCNTGFQGTIKLPDRKGGIQTMPYVCNYGAIRPTIDSTIFPSTPRHPFWSASPAANNNDLMWSVHFNGGGSVGYNKIVRNFVRVVRTGQ